MAGKAKVAVDSKKRNPNAIIATLDTLPKKVATGAGAPW